MDAGTTVAWTVAALTFVALIASITGRGTGPFGLGGMTHMLWSYVLFLVAIVALFWAMAKISARGDERR